MSLLLLQTKLHIPPRRPNAVTRPLLLTRLNAGLSARLILLCAPAGYGKTTLICEWLATAPASTLPLAWLAVDEEDNAFDRFWTYVIAALQTLVPDVGASLVTLLAQTQSPAVEPFVTALINELVGIPDPFLLVLDDYHLIQSPSIHQSLAFLLHHLPPQMHLILLSRTTPPLPLNRLRGRGQLVELLATDLRFTQQESDLFLNQHFDLALSPQQVITLEQGTEGWIAGLQVAALALQRQPDVAAFLATFRGRHRTVADYFLTEVLDAQAEDVQTFLLHTSVLSRLCGPLCDFVTERPHGQAMLARLETLNLFTVPLDEERHWYRYHHLFRDALRAHLQTSEPAIVPALRKRAAHWCQTQGYLAEAIDYALATQDFEFAADVLTTAAEPLLAQNQLTLLTNALGVIPIQILEARPRLCISYASLLHSTTPQRAQIEVLLRKAEQRLTADPAERPIPEADARAMLGEIAGIRLLLHSLTPDLERCQEVARQALALLPQDAWEWRQIVHVYLAAAYSRHGDMVQAEQLLSRIIAAQGGLDNSDVSWMYLELAFGHLRRAHDIFQQTKLASGEPFVGQQVLHMVNLANLYYERNQLPAALEHSQIGILLGQQLGYGVTYGHYMAARVHYALGDHAAAAASLEAMFAVAHVPDFIPLLAVPQDLRAVRAHHWLASGNLDAARAWANQSGLSSEDMPEYAYLLQHLVLIRVLMADGKFEPAIAFLERLGAHAAAQGRPQHLIEILALQALALHALAQPQSALRTLERALLLAESEGYLRTFLDQGKAMAHLLRMAAAAGIVPHYTEKLLAAFAAEPTPLPPSLPPRIEQLVDPLSTREVEVLTLLAEGMSNQRIAEKLQVTVGTVKTHVNSIYTKLNVHNRTEAAVRARALNLLSHHP